MRRAVGALALTGAMLVGRAAVAAPAEITVTKAGEGWLIVMKLDHQPFEGEGMKLLSPRAQALCGSKPIRWGRFKYDTGNDPKTGNFSYVLNQEFACGGPADGPPGSQVPDSWKPTQGDSDLVAERTRQLLGYLDDDDVEKTYSLFEPLTGVTRKDLGDYLGSVRAKLGVIADRKLVSMGYAANPPEEPLKGGYVSVVLQAEYEGAPVVCGRVIWYRHGEGDWRIMRFNQDVPPADKRGAPSPCA